MDAPISRRNVLAGIGASTALLACSRNGIDSAVPQLGIAVVGIGNLSLNEVIPALRTTKHCYLAGLVSSSPDKLREVGARNGVPPSGQYTYDNLEKMAENPAIDIVYVVLPNALHAEFAVRAARAGKHVFCEKPMAVSVEQCRTMIAACNEADRYLGVAYRLQFEPHYREMIRLARETVFGPVRIIKAGVGFPVRANEWRLQRDLAGGGALMEMGIYAIQAARHLAHEEPLEVVGQARTDDTTRFGEVEESAFWTMNFPSGLVAHCASSYTTGMDRLWAGAANGYFQMEPAYSYSGLRGMTSNGPIKHPQLNQFAAQLDEFSRCIQERVPLIRGTGAEGLRDLEIITGIYTAMTERRYVNVAPQV